MLPWFQSGSFPLYLAPMAGYTDMAFRQLCKQQGADVMVTEFVPAEALLRDGEKSWQAVDFSEEQRPMGVQIFGSSTEAMAEAARRIEERLRPDFIDLNFGCPADRVTCADAGSSLLRDLPKLERIARHVVEAVPTTPVTGKIRIGWDAGSIVAVEAAQRLEAAGVRVVSVHGRTKEQGYRGDADWSVIAEVVSSISLPVVGNGGLQKAADIVQARERTGMHGAMIGRAALGNPWLFAEMKHQLRHGLYSAPLQIVTVEERWQTILDFTETTLRQMAALSNNPGFPAIRAKIKALTKGLPGGRRLRSTLDQVESLAQLREIAARSLSSDAPAAEQVA